MSDLRPAGGNMPPDQLLSARTTLVVLLVTTALLLLGSGLFGTLTGVRASIAGIPTTQEALEMLEAGVYEDEPQYPASRSTGDSNGSPPT